MPKPAFQSVDDYIASLPDQARAALTRVCAAIRKAVPAAEESVSYNMAAYKLNGKPLLYAAGWKKHYSLYPATAPLVEAFAAELMPYEVEKGTIRFPLAAPVPTALIARLAKFRAGQLRPSARQEP